MVAEQLDCSEAAKSNWDVGKALACPGRGCDDCGPCVACGGEASWFALPGTVSRVSDMSGDSK